MEPMVKMMDKEMEGIPMDSDERTAKTVAKMVDYVSMGEPNWFCGQNLDSPRIDINYTYTM